MTLLECLEKNGNQFPFVASDGSRAVMFWSRTDPNNPKGDGFIDSNGSYYNSIYAGWTYVTIDPYLSETYKRQRDANADTAQEYILKHAEALKEIEKLKVSNDRYIRQHIDYGHILADDTHQISKLEKQIETYRIAIEAAFGTSIPTVDEIHQFLVNKGNDLYESRKLEKATRKALNKALEVIDSKHRLNNELHKQINALMREVKVLRHYGNKDCTAMADEELNRKFGRMTGSHYENRRLMFACECGECFDAELSIIEHEGERVEKCPHCNRLNSRVNDD